MKLLPLLADRHRMGHRNRTPSGNDSFRSPRQCEFGYYCCPDSSGISWEEIPFLGAHVGPSFVAKATTTSHIQSFFCRPQPTYSDAYSRAYSLRVRCRSSGTAPRMDNARGMLIRGSGTTMFSARATSMVAGGPCCERERRRLARSATHPSVSGKWSGFLTISTDMLFRSSSRSGGLVAGRCGVSPMCHASS
jgi:hypothetical protein